MDEDRTRVGMLALTAAAAGFLAGGVIAMAPWAGDATVSEAVHITYMQKNRAWPLKGLITMEPCAAATCLAI